MWCYSNVLFTVLFTPQSGILIAIPNAHEVVIDRFQYLDYSVTWSNVGILKS